MIFIPILLFMHSCLCLSDKALDGYIDLIIENLNKAGVDDSINNMAGNYSQGIDNLINKHQKTSHLHKRSFKTTMLKIVKPSLIKDFIVKKFQKPMMKRFKKPLKRTFSARFQAMKSKKAKRHLYSRQEQDAFIHAESEKLTKQILEDFSQHNLQSYNEFKEKTGRVARLKEKISNKVSNVVSGVKNKIKGIFSKRNEDVILLLDKRSLLDPEKPMSHLIAMVVGLIASILVLPLIGLGVIPAGVSALIAFGVLVTAASVFLIMPVVNKILLGFWLWYDPPASSNPFGKSLSSS